MKPFDLEKAKNGAPVCTRDGRKARIVCWDFKGLGNKHILALIEQEDDTEEVVAFNTDGSFSSYISDYDLMMASQKHEGWVNMYRSDVTGRYMVGDIFESEKQAKLNTHSTEYIATVKIEWEE